MLFDTKFLGGARHSTKVHRTPRWKKVLWALFIGLFAAIACGAAGKLFTSVFIVAFAAISWHFIVRDEKVMCFEFTPGTGGASPLFDDRDDQFDDLFDDKHVWKRPVTDKEWLHDPDGLML